MKSWQGLSAGIWLSLVGGCASQAEQAGPVARQLTASAHCGLQDRGLLYLASGQDLQQLSGLPAQALTLAPLNAVDFSREHVVIVALGQKTSAGYGVTLDSAQLIGDRLTLEMRLQSPPPDSMVAQVMTTPCAAVAVINQGWSHLSVYGEGYPAVSHQR
ncbi:protease complex subunit PrcB family protein [Marinobacter sp. SS21]|uniref:protease complex subunit PrcB family protein n=1 Tax=Marinobacter sp. SS21 TaxID=2979460 RepID=UPI002330A4A6|nr:protease complex subunit PrcB family protein [Marinobacter sp. SS21]MDC0661654.1 protease complex subunit PrcB family protein [Marinobacter sp. SS21]